MLRSVVAAGGELAWRPHALLIRPPCDAGCLELVAEVVGGAREVGGGRGIEVDEAGVLRVAADQIEIVRQRRVSPRVQVVRGQAVAGDEGVDVGRVRRAHDLRVVVVLHHDGEHGRDRTNREVPDHVEDDVHGAASGHGGPEGEGSVAVARQGEDAVVGPGLTRGEVEGRCHRGRAITGVEAQVSRARGADGRDVPRERAGGRGYAAGARDRHEAGRAGNEGRALSRLAGVEDAAGSQGIVDERGRCLCPGRLGGGTGQQQAAEREHRRHPPELHEQVPPP